MPSQEEVEEAAMGRIGGPASEEDYLITFL